MQRVPAPASRRLVPVVLLAAVALLAADVPAGAYVPDRTPRRDLEAQVRLTLQQPPARGVAAGVLIRRAGRDLVAVREEEPFLPASLIKLLTTSVAIERFGPDHRFTTQVTAPTAAATVPWLALIGGGDPTLATRGYAQGRFHPPPGDPNPLPAFPSGAPTIEDLARRVHAAGIRVVTGNLYADASIFDGYGAAPGWLPSYFGERPSSGVIAGLTLNEGFADDNRERLFADPPAGAGEALEAALARVGVRVAGDVVAGRPPAEGREVARVSSPPLREIVTYINLYSINYPSELLLKGLGAAFGGEGSTAGGVRIVLETLQEAGVPIQELRMYDGSGLSRMNRVTPRTLAGVLEWMLERNGDAGEVLRQSLPIAGRPGQLAHRMTEAPARGNVRGKTGFLREVRALAGWAYGADGIPFVYVTIFNEAPRPADLAGPLDVIASILARFPRL